MNLIQNTTSYILGRSTLPTHQTAPITSASTVSTNKVSPVTSSTVPTGKLKETTKEIELLFKYIFTTS